MEALKAPRIRDVAVAAGVSSATVSRVLNDHKHVAAEVRERVFAAVGAVGYRTDLIARTLRTGQTKTIGLLSSDLTSPIAALTCVAAVSAASAAGYAMMLCDSNFSAEKERDHIMHLIDRRADGVIVFAANDRVNNIEPLLQRRTAVVLANAEMAGVHTDCVLSDDEAGFYVATKHLIERGHRAIAWVGGPQTLRSPRLARRGYLRALREGGLSVSPDYLLTCELSEQAGRLALRNLLELPRRPSAILAATSHLTLGCLREVLARNISVPTELSIIGCDDSIATSLFSPPLTVVARPMAKVTEAATALLIGRLEGRYESDSRQRLKFASSLLVRESTRAV